MPPRGALEADDLPPEVLAVQERYMFRIVDLTAADVGWRGLTLDAQTIMVMVSCTIAGSCCRASCCVVPGWV